MTTSSAVRRSRRSRSRSWRSSGPSSASTSISSSSSAAAKEADVDVVGDVVRKARGELAEVLEFESRGFELERALIAGLDDGSVGEGPEVAPAELSGVLVSVSADEFGSAVGFRHGRALDLALWRA